jgi:hypothetical protein
MICIRCQKDSTYPERRDNGGKCPGCNKPFAFDPREGAKMTDKAYQRAIDLVSAEGQVKWGVEHLYYELSRRNRTVAARVLAGILIPILFALTALIFFPALLVVGPLLLWWGYSAFSGPKFELMSRGDFEKMWDRWGQVHGKPKGLIVRKPQEAKPAPRTVEPDLGDYSFDRAVICDRARTVDLLLANNFHFENNCAVLSSGGYPQQAFETVKRMLLRNPRLEVFVLHDITEEGCRLAHQLANDPRWFRGTGVRIVDVGLRPVHAGPFVGLYQDAKHNVQPGLGISPEEARWLSKHTLELAAIRPEQIIKRLFRAMNRNMAAAPGETNAPLAGRGMGPALPAGSTRMGAAATGAAAVAGAAMLAPGLSQAEQEAELARQQKKKPQDNSGGDGGGGGGSDSGGGFEVDTDSFSSDADASDGGADSFG